MLFYELSTHSALLAPGREKNHEADTLPVLRFAPRQVIDIKVKLKESKRFWSNLSDEICSRGNITESDDEQCWNSHAKGR